VHPSGPSPFLLGPAHVRPRATRASPLSLPPGPARSAPACRYLNSNVPPARVASGPRPAGTRSGHLPPVEARPHDVVPHRVALPWSDPPPLSFLSLSAAPTHPPVSTPLRLLLLSARASPPLPALGPPPPATGSPLSFAGSGRAPPPSATPRGAPP
jgi:hypothetical protein